MADTRELLEQYAQSEPDHVVLNFSHGAYSPKAFDALGAVLELHKPTLYDKWTRPTEDLDAAVQWHCSRCMRSGSGAVGCATVQAISKALEGP